MFNNQLKKDRAETLHRFGIEAGDMIKVDNMTLIVNENYLVSNYAGRVIPGLKLKNLLENYPFSKEGKWKTKLNLTSL